MRNKLKLNLMLPDIPDNIFTDLMDKFIPEAEKALNEIAEEVIGKKLNKVMYMVAAELDKDAKKIDIEGTVFTKKGNKWQIGQSTLTYDNDDDFWAGVEAAMKKGRKVKFSSVMVAKELVRIARQVR